MTTSSATAKLAAVSSSKGGNGGVRRATLPATTLTTSLASVAKASTRSHKAAARKERLRDYFAGGSRVSSSSSGGTSSFGARLFGTTYAAAMAEEEVAAAADDGAAAAAGSATVSPGGQQKQPHTAESLYELALEGVIDLDTQPILQCQEIYNKMIGNHQTFLMTKEQVIKLLQKDQAQHERDLAKEDGEEEGGGDDDDADTDADAGAIDATHDDGNTSPSRRSKWFSRLEGLGKKQRSPSAAAGATTTTPTSSFEDAANADANEMEASIRAIVQKKEAETASGSGGGNGNGSSTSRRLGPALHRFFSGRDNGNANEAGGATTQRGNIAEEPPACVILEDTLEEYGQAESFQSAETAAAGVVGDPQVTGHDGAVPDGGNLPNSAIDPALSSMDGTDQQDIAGTESNPGGGVEEFKVEEPDNEVDGGDATATADAGEAETEGRADASTPPATASNKAGEDLPPLVGYWAWKHNSFNFQQHKMILHLAKNSDLALHLVLAIIVNQVRSERNHTIFATTGLHPAWFFIDPKNPKAMIS